MNKNYMIFGAVIIMAILALPVCLAAESTVNLALTSYTHTQNLQPVVLKYEPYPVGPGEYMDVWIKFENEESGDIDDLTIEFVPEYPFYLDAGETKTRHFGRILAHSSVVVKYRVRVDADAVSGDNYLKYRYRYVQSDLRWIEAGEKVRVQTREALISVVSVHTSPENIVPGQKAVISISLRNSASSVIRDIGLYLDLTMSSVGSNRMTSALTSVVLDSYYNAIPLAPVGTSTEKRLTHLRPGEEAVIEYDLIAFPDAAAGIYKVPIIMTYSDEIGMNYTKADILGIVISAEPDLKIKIEDNTIYKKRETGEITVKAVNKGLIDVKFMTIKLADSDDYKIISEQIVYVGDVDSDDYETADFRLYVKNLDKDNRLIIPIEIEYLDALNREYSEKIVIMMPVYSQKMRGAAGSSTLTVVILLVAVMGAGWFFYKRWEKKKKAAKQAKDAKR